MGIAALHRAGLVEVLQGDEVNAGHQPQERLAGVGADRPDIRAGYREGVPIDVRLRPRGRDLDGESPVVAGVQRTSNDTLARAS